jgi:hypothetical protein
MSIAINQPSDTGSYFTLKRYNVISLPHNGINRETVRYIYNDDHEIDPTFSMNRKIVNRTLGALYTCVRGNTTDTTDPRLIMTVTDTENGNDSINGAVTYLACLREGYCDTARGAFYLEKRTDLLSIEIQGLNDQSSHDTSPEPINYYMSK